MSRPVTKLKPLRMVYPACLELVRPNKNDRETYIIPKLFNFYSGSGFLIKFPFFF